jgi:hypothetical protein
MMERGVRLGRLAVTADVMLAAILTVFLAGATDSDGDVVPRPVLLLLLYATPGIVGAIGVVERRRSLLFAAGAALLPGSLLSFAGVTLVFVIPAVLSWAAAAAMSRPDRGSRLAELLEVVVELALMLGAAIALFSTTTEGCTADGSVCGSGFLSWTGVAWAVALDAIAIAFAVWRSGLRQAVGRGGAS